MAELISGPLPDSLGEQAQGTNAFQSTTGEVLGAEATSAFQGNPTIAIGRQNLRNYGTTFMDPDAPPDFTRAEPQMSADDANKQYGIAGSLSFKAPVSASVAKSLNLEHQAAIDRQNLIDRRGDSILTGGVARFGTDLLAGLLDPLNVASAFIPVVPEAFVASRLAAASGAFGRAAVRAGVGAAEGAVGQAALEPLNFGIASQDHNDYTLGEALRNIALGGFMGAGLHAGLGAIVDRLHPDARADVMRSAIAQTVEDRPVDVAPMFQVGEAAKLSSAAAEEPHLLAALPEDARAMVEQIDARLQDPELSASDRAPLAAERQDVLDTAAPLAQAGAETGARDMAQRAMSPAPDPAITRAERVNKAVEQIAPQVEPEMNKQLAEATKMAQEAQAAVQREVAAGRIMESEAGLSVAEEHEGNAKAVQAAAACLIARGF